MHRYDVLGPLLVDGSVEATPRRPAQRRLLSLLLLERDRVVIRDVLIERMWPHGPPTGAINTLQAHVSGLRRLIGPEAVTSHPNGYGLAIEPEGLDADRFATLLERARASAGAGDPAGARQACDQGLALWRGPPFPELADDAFARPAIRRLVDLETDMRSLRVGVAIELGHWSEAIEDLHGLLALHPHREPLWELLMLAHHRAGRRAEAMAAYRDAGAALADLDLEPGRHLRALEERIRNEDPSLDVSIVGGDLRSRNEA